MATLRSISVEIVQVAGFAENIGAQILIQETLYDEASSAEVGSVVHCNCVIPQSRLAVSGAVNDSSDYVNLEIKNGNITVLKLDRDTWAKMNGAKFNSTDLQGIYDTIIAIKQS